MPEAEFGPDHLDDRLIGALREDGRASIQALARGLGLSRDVVSQRLHGLVERGGLRIVAALDPGVLGLNVLLHAVVVVAGPARPVAETIAAMPETRLVSMISGSAPLVFESRNADVAEVDAMLARIRGIPAVRQVRINTYSRVLKGFFMSASRVGVKPEVALDDLDGRLVVELQRDGRVSYQALGEAVHLSPSATRARVRRLLDSGVIRIAVIPPGGLARNRIAVGIGVVACGDIRPIHECLVGSRAIDFVARTHGSFDFIATVGGSSSAGVLAVIERIRALRQVDCLETWTHLDTVKEDYELTLGLGAGPAESS